MTISSDQLHNRNCYLYLKTLFDVIPPYVRSEIKNLDVLNENAEFNPEYPYGDLYKEFFKFTETNLEKIKKSADENIIDAFILAIYHNDNHVLEEIFKDIGDIPLEHRPSGKSIKTTISQQLKNVQPKVNKSSGPAEVGSGAGRMKALLSRNFKPQQSTSLATVKHFAHQQPGDPVEYRFGTQGQRDNGKPRVSPLFEAWLDVLERKYPAEDESSPPITHVYFNYLGWDRDDMEGIKEKELSESLHALEERHKNIAVITLPADKGLMGEEHYKKTQDELLSSKIYKEFIAIAKQEPQTVSKIKDFHISPNTRKSIFGDNEEETLQGLLDNSIVALGFTDKEYLSSAQSQALLFHYTKFEIPNYILTTVQPKGINFTCKDAIDRGAVASSYYNLMKSFERNQPLDQIEFETALHAAAAMVKARGMNHHLNLIWNAIDVYVEAHYEELLSDSHKGWLINWRDFNCPHARVKELLQLRIEQNLQELETLGAQCPENQGIKKGLEILIRIQEQAESGVSGQRLLLETVNLTNRIIKRPSDNKTENYEALAQQLRIACPLGYVIGGLMESLLAAILYIPSFGKSNTYFNAGIATFKAGLNALKRDDMHQVMINLVGDCNNHKKSLVEVNSDTDADDQLSESGVTPSF